MKIEKLVLGPLKTNCYFIINNEECIVIDSATNADKILEFCESLNVKLKAVLLTHGHFDHCMACKSLQEKNIPIYVSSFDGNEIQNSPKNMGLNSKYSFVPDVLLNGNEECRMTLHWTLPGRRSASAGQSDKGCYAGFFLFVVGVEGQNDKVWLLRVVILTPGLGAFLGRI